MKNGGKTFVWRLQLVQLYNILNGQFFQFSSRGCCTSLYLILAVKVVLVTICCSLQFQPPKISLSRPLELNKQEQLISSLSHHHPNLCASLSLVLVTHSLQSKIGLFWRLCIFPAFQSSGCEIQGGWWLYCSSMYCYHSQKEVEKGKLHKKCH